MNRLWIILAVLVVVAGCSQEERINIAKGQPLEVKLVNAPNPDQEAKRIAELQARVKTLEDWAVRQGGKFK